MTVPNNPEQAFNMANRLFGLDMATKYSVYVQKKLRAKRYVRTASKDSTKNKVYQSEWDFQKQVEIKKFADYDEARKYMKNILKSKTWKSVVTNRGHSDPFLIEKKKVSNERTAGMSWGYKIQLSSQSGLDQYTLLHELAHSAGYMHHDVSFRQCLLKLVSRFMGREAAKILKTEFKKRGLKMTLKTKIMTPEQWYDSYIKMKGLREK